MYPANRQRLSVAHELGHVVLHHDSQHFIEYGVPQADQGDPPGYDWRHESSANAFAAELLMPAEELRSEVCAYSVSRLARRYRVSGSHEFSLGKHRPLIARCVARTTA